MQHDSDTPKHRALGDEALEARIVAWVLGEASPFEVAELERLCAERPEWEVFRRRILAIHHLLGESENAAADPEWRLAPEKRGALDHAFGAAAPAANATVAATARKRRRSPRLWLSAAACVLLLAAMAGLFAPQRAMHRRSIESADMTDARETRLVPLETEHPPELIEGTPVPVNPERIQATRAQTRTAQSPSAESVPVPRQSAPARTATTDDARLARARSAPPAPAAPAPADSAGLYRFSTAQTDERGARSEAPVGRVGVDAFADTSLPPEDAEHLGRLDQSVEDARRELAGSVRNHGITDGDDSLGVSNAMLSHQLEQEKLRLESQLQGLREYDSEQLIIYAAGLNIPDNNVKKLTPQYLERQLELDRLKSTGLDEGHPDVAAAGKQVEELRAEIEEQVGEMSATLATRLEITNDRIARLDGMRNEARDHAIQRGLDADDSTEAKTRFEEARPSPADSETPAAEDPFSTFSLNISDASFVIARDAMRRGERPAPEQVRIEEFYNAFDYGDPAPAPGEPVAAAIEQCAHPVLPGRNLVRVALRTGGAGRLAEQPLHLTLLIDQSGSMIRPDRRAALDNTLDALAGLLGESDRVNLIGFARSPRIIAEALPGSRAAELPRLVHQQAAEGGTNMETGLELAREIAARHHNPHAQNRVVLISDGAVNLGDADPERLAEMVTAMRREGIATDIAGIGTDGLNDALLSELARHGDGRYHVVTPESGDRLARDLAGAFRPAAEDVRVQVVFNPERVRGWRLVGFEDHLMAAEDFRDDSVDAAEMAADEAGVAIYQIDPLPGGAGEIGEVFVRFRDPAQGLFIERSWPLRYAADPPALDSATPSMQLATLAMLVAEKLRGGPLGASIDTDEQTEVIAALRTRYQGDARVGDLLDMARDLADR